jgi:hypothetical protein
MLEITLKTWGTCWEHSGNIEGIFFKDTPVALLKWELGIWVICKFESRGTRKVTLCFQDFVLLSSSHQYHWTSVGVFISRNFKFLNLWYYRYHVKSHCRFVFQTNLQWDLTWNCVGGTHSYYCATSWLYKYVVQLYDNKCFHVKGHQKRWSSLQATINLYNVSTWVVLVTFWFNLSE